VPTVTEYCSNALRGVVVAPRGRKLLVGDLANIEGRGVAWLAGESWKLRAFADADAGRGPDLYRLAYALAFNVSPESIDPHTVEGYFKRQIGKVIELMFSYGGGVGACLTGADTYRIDLEVMAAACWPQFPRDIQIEAQQAWVWAVEQRRTFDLPPAIYRACDGLKRVWRWTNPKITDFWPAMKNQVWAALMQGGTRELGFLTFDTEAAWLRLRLPSGRYLCYPSPKLRDGQLTFLGTNPYTKQWGRLKTWGGTLTENATQALSRDVLAVGLLRAEVLGLNPVLHVHDEIVCEVPDTSDYSAAELEHCLTAPIPWAPGLPLAAKVFETDRYRKD